jgi:hypothetical protein
VITAIRLADPASSPLLLDFVKAEPLQLPR